MIKKILIEEANIVIGGFFFMFLILLLINFGQTFILIRNFIFESIVGIIQFVF